MRFTEATMEEAVGMQIIKSIKIHRDTLVSIFGPPHTTGFVDYWRFKFETGAVCGIFGRNWTHHLVCAHSQETWDALNEILEGHTYWSLK